jgi:excisionase family DNA binding protein
MTKAASSGTGKDGASSARPSRIPAAIPASRQPADTRPEALSEVRFLTVAEVASVMRVSKMTVYRIVHAGEIPAVRVGRSFRVPEKAVHEYLRAAFIEAG